MSLYCSQSTISVIAAAHIVSFGVLLLEPLESVMILWWCITAIAISIDIARGSTTDFCIAMSCH
jgi:hypothetical protein